MIASSHNTPTGRLAPDESIELHELLSLMTTTLVKQKETAGKVTDPQLRQLYLQSIQMTEKQIAQLYETILRMPV